MKDALIQRIKDVIVSHSNERRHWYEVGKGVMDYLARDILSYIEVNGYLFAPVRPNQKVYIVYRKKVKEGVVTFVGFGEVFQFNALYGNISASFFMRQYTEADIGKLVFTAKEDAEKAEARLMQTIKAGFVPYAMLYRDGSGNTDREWREFQREWCRPIIVGAKLREFWKGGDE